MPRPVGYGRPNTSVFPARWAADAAAVLDDTYESVVKVGLPGEPVWSEEQGRSVVTVPDPVYDGPATITPISDSDDAPMVGGDQVPTVRYEVKVPAPTVGLTPDHWISVTSSADPGLVGRILHVDSVEHGDRRFSRILYATLTD